MTPCGDHEQIEWHGKDRTSLPFHLNVNYSHKLNLVLGRIQALSFSFSDLYTCSNDAYNSPNSFLSTLPATGLRRSCPISPSVFQGWLFLGCFQRCGFCRLTCMLELNRCAASLLMKDLKAMRQGWTNGTAYWQTSIFCLLQWGQNVQKWCQISPRKANIYYR